MNFFVDNCLAPKLTRALHEIAQPDHNFVHLRDKFKPSTPDVEWISSLAKEKNWVIISGDWRITRKPLEKQAWKDSELTGFFLKRGWTNIEPNVQLSKLAILYPEIIKAASKHPSKTGFIIGINDRRYNQFDKF